MITPPNAPTQGPADTHTPPSARVQLSLSEINALCVRAARGAGLAWGEAEEAGWAASWLSQAGLSGPSITLAWLGDLASLARPVPARDLWSATSGAQCPLRCGIALADFAGLPEGPGIGALTVETIAHPLMALPFVARAAARTGLDLRARWGHEDISLHSATVPSIHNLAEATGRQIADLRITPTESTKPCCPTGARAPPIRRIAGADKRALDALALRITVPASALSRTGAGAATDDND